MLFPIGKQIGEPLQSYQLNVRRKSKQVIEITWYDDDSHTDPAVEINGLTMTMIIGDREEPDAVWDATLVGNKATWTVSDEASDLPFSLYRGCVILTDNTGEESLLMALHVVVAPPA